MDYLILTAVGAAMIGAFLLPFLAAVSERGERKVACIQGAIASVAGAAVVVAFYMGAQA